MGLFDSLFLFEKLLKLSSFPFLRKPKSDFGESEPDFGKSCFPLSRQNLKIPLAPLSRGNWFTFQTMSFFKWISLFKSKRPHPFQKLLFPPSRNIHHAAVSQLHLPTFAFQVFRHLLQINQMRIVHPVKPIRL